jgi:hypothetical protein
MTEDLMLHSESRNLPTVNDDATGSRLVFYEYCISLVFITLRRPSRLHRLAPGRSGVVEGLPYTLLTLALGWWGIPWGIIYTPLVLWTNLSGGREITAEELLRLQPSESIASVLSQEFVAQVQRPACSG